MSVEAGWRDDLESAHLLSEVKSGGVVRHRFGLCVFLGMLLHVALGGGASSLFWSGCVLEDEGKSYCRRWKH